jgi:hypothetical protein
MWGMVWGRPAESFPAGIALEKLFERTEQRLDGSNLAYSTALYRYWARFTGESRAVDGRRGMKLGHRALYHNEFPRPAWLKAQFPIQQVQVRSKQKNRELKNLDYI